MKTQWSYWRWRYHKVSLRIQRALRRRVYRDRYPSIDRTVLVAGAGRSGTTWLGDLIASQAPSRIMFEPFNPKLVKAYRAFNYYQYMRPDDDNEGLVTYCNLVFSGQIRDPWIDRQVNHIAPQYRVVKAVRANLFLKWTYDHFPAVKQVFIIRHPCAIVLSRMQLDWATDTDIAPFLEQSKLIDDFLADKQDVIRRANTDEEKHAIIWCISNMVPLSQFQTGQTHIVFYEHLCTQSEAEVPALFRAIGREYRESVYDNLSRPSSTSRPHSAVVAGMDRVSVWQDRLSSSQVDRILRIVEAFGLNYLYGDSLLPVAMSHDNAG